MINWTQIFRFLSLIHGLFFLLGFKFLSCLNLRLVITTPLFHLNICNEKLLLVYIEVSNFKLWKVRLGSRFILTKASL